MNIKNIEINKLLLYISVFLVIALSILTIQHKESYAQLCEVTCKEKYGESSTPVSSGFSCSCEYTGISNIDLGRVGGVSGE